MTRDQSPDGDARAVAAALTSHPVVIDAEIVGDPGDDSLTALVCIDPRAAVTVATLRRHVAAQVPAEWVPRQVRFTGSAPLPAG